jgi:uncharacterized membrane protein YjgN (DUF898 family)
MMDNVMEQEIQQKHTLNFTGSGSEFFKIWIVNIVLSIVTLGVYSAWAKVRTQRYFYGNTLLNDSPFEYHATPMQILIGRIIALVLLVVYIVASETSPITAGVVLVLLLVMTPWIVYRSIRFNARMTSHRNVRFNFNGLTLPFYKYMFLYPIIPLVVLLLLVVLLGYLGVSPEVVGVFTALAVLSLYVTFPWVQRNITEYVMNHYTYGQGQFSTSPPLSTRKYYMRYFVAILLFLLVFVIVGGVSYAFGLFDAFFVIAASSGDVGNLDSDMQSQLGLAIVLVYGSLFFVGFILKPISKQVYGVMCLLILNLIRLLP